MERILGVGRRCCGTTGWKTADPNRQPNENGDIEQRHSASSELLIERCYSGSRNFGTQEEYRTFLGQLFEQLNSGDQNKPKAKRGEIRQQGPRPSVEILFPDIGQAAGDVDVDEPTPPVLRWNQSANLLDLTYSILRAAHPVHINT